MPDGLTHLKYYNQGWVATLPTSAIIAVAINPWLGVGMLVGYGLGRWIDPDLDQVGITSSEGRIINELRIVGYVIVGYSTIYGAWFRRYHRSWITHFPFVSSAIRLIYFFWWLYFVINVLYPWQESVIIGTWVGLSMADTIHYVLDKFFPDTGKTNLNLR